MKKFLLVYRGAVQPENGKKHMSDWMAWVKEMGVAMADPGMPVYPSRTVSQKGVADTQSDNPISGISIIEAENIDKALELVASCPHISIGGSIEVAEAMNLPMA